jgi:DNA-binding NtrC family response regulator
MLYLKDVHALPLVGQGALLDVLPSRQHETADVRVVASTDADLRALSAAGHFRQDLAWQLQVMELALPSLRERRADVVAIATELLAERARGRSFGRDAVAALENHRWPGNFPELTEAIDRAVAASSGLIRSEHLGLLRTPPSAERPPTIPGATLAEIERYAILETLKAQRGSTSRAARVLGMSVRKIQYKLNEYGTPRSQAGGASQRAE